MKEKYTPPQEEIKKAEKNKQRELPEQRKKEKEEKPNFKRDIQDARENLETGLTILSRLSAQNERYIDVLEHGTPEELKAFTDELIEGSKGVEAENRRRLQETFDQFDEEVEKAKNAKDPFWGLESFLGKQHRTICVTTFDDYLIENKPLDQSIKYYFNGVELLQRLIKVAEENNIKHFTQPQNDIDYLGKVLIRRIQTKEPDLTKEEKQQIISKIESFIKNKSLELL